MQPGRPRTWNLRSIRTFTIVFGWPSSVFDILTFLTLRMGIPRQRHPLRGCWFIELAVTALAATLVLRILMTGLLGTPYNMNQASYDLARLSGNGRSPGSRAANLHVLTCDGLRFANENSRRWGS